ncbi:MAG: DUF1800 domain-containing protein [Gammaproteobacteria bacterium]|nr:DUF1800 domain-containing protein [Gammaproteobacteria bacterium]
MPYLLALLILFLLPPAAAAGQLTVRLIDHVSGAGLAGVRVAAHEQLPDGSLVWAAARDTDGEGKARFDLAGLGEGRTYVLKARPHAHWLTSAPITETGWHGWRVGRLAVQVLDGRTGAPLAGLALTLRERGVDGRYPHVMNVETDGAGWLRLDPDILGEVPLVLRALSPTDGEWKYSAPYWGGGEKRFVVGNMPLEVELVNGVSGAGLSDEWVELYRRRDDGRLSLQDRRRTDAAGRVDFDVDGLGAGTEYVVRAEPYGRRLTSGDIGVAGVHRLEAGRLEVVLENGANGQPYRWKDVRVLEVQPDGSRRGVRQVRTDGDGVVRLDPPALGSRPYVLQAASPSDGSWKLSEPYEGPGRFRFVVGNAALTVRLIDHVSGTGLAGVRVAAHEQLPDGSLVWAAARDTDGEGKARFDLAGLGEGRTYVLKARPHAHWLTSAPITETGWHGWRVGRLAVQVLDGRTGAPLAGLALTLRERGVDGRYPHVMNVETDGAGWLRLDPDVLGEVPLVLRALSPTDGEWKYSAPYWGGGEKRFVVGNMPLEVELVNGVSGAGLSDEWVELYRRRDDGRLSLQDRRRTDAAGRVDFDVDGLGAGTEYVVRAEPYGRRLTSGDIGVAGVHRLEAGRLEVVLENGANGQPYRWKDVRVLEVQPDGSRRSVRQVRTDGDGVVRLDPPALGSRPYVLQAASPSDGSWKLSEPYEGPGRFRFVVGNAALTVRLIDHVSGAGLARVRVAAHEQLPDGSLVWAAARDTDGEGKARFDLAGLGEGRTYVLKARPHAHWLTSAPITETGWHGWRVGTVPVSLVDSTTGQPLAGIEVVALQKAADGTLARVKAAATDAHGEVRLDLPELGNGKVYVLKAIDPYGDGANHFGPLVRHRGPVTVATDPDDPHRPDQEPPQLLIAAPAPAAAVGDHGFVVEGMVTDNERVRSVSLVLTDGGGLLRVLPAELDRHRGTWRAAIGPVTVATPTQLTITATAQDQAFNSATAAVDVLLVRDVTPPIIDVGTHRSGEHVPDGAFVVTGTVRDDTGPASMAAELLNGDGQLMDGRATEVAATGAWAYTAFAGAAGAAGDLTLRLIATDTAGNTTARELALHTNPAARQRRGLLDRIGFGATPAGLAEVERLGIAAYLDNQLDPARIDDTTFEAWRATQTFEHPADHLLAHALHSRRQLREVMTWFWDNHFNTALQGHGHPQWEIAENDAFRANALGRFRDLLEVSARSPAMLRFLDGVANRARKPNENYARELLELHTLGLDGGYTEADVAAVARAFTGWTIDDDAFHFNDDIHDTGPKTVLGTHLAAGRGMEDGEQVLDILAAHPATADHICGKLLVLLLGRADDAALHADCVAAFMAGVNAPDQMARVVGVIVRSPAMLAAAQERSSVRTPLEYVLAALRVLGPAPEATMPRWWLHKLGMPLFHNPIPTGYPEAGEHWVSTHGLRARLSFLDRVASDRGPFQGAIADPGPELQWEGITTTDGIVGTVLAWVHGPDFTRADWELGRAILTNDGARPFEPSGPQAGRRLRELLLVALALPAFHFQ